MDKVSTGAKIELGGETLSEVEEHVTESHPKCKCCYLPITTGSDPNFCMSCRRGETRAPEDIPVDMKKSGVAHRWTGCKMLNRSQRRALLKQIKIEDRRKKT